MTTFIEMKFKKSDDQTNIEKYGVAAKITEYYIISKESKYHPSKIHYEKAIISCRNLQVERKKVWLKSVHKQENWALLFRESFEVNLDR